MGSLYANRFDDIDVDLEIRNGSRPVVCRFCFLPVMQITVRMKVESIQVLRVVSKLQLIRADCISGDRRDAEQDD